MWRWRISTAAPRSKKRHKLRPGTGDARASSALSHSHPLSPPGASERVGQILVDMEERRIGLRLQIDVEQGHDRLEALRVDHRPLLERERHGVENELEMRRAAKRRLVLDLDRD